MERRDDFIRELRRIFEELTAFSGMLAGNGFIPVPVAGTLKQPYEEAIETEKEYVLTIELPGVDAADVRVLARRREIEIECRGEQEDGVNLTYPTETDIKPRELKVTLKNRVLEVRAPKK